MEGIWSISIVLRILYKEAFEGIIHGENMKAYISQVETIVVEISSSLGSIELNLGLEM